MANTITAFDRRKARRYLLRLPIHYRVSERGAMPYSGSGTTSDMSTSGLSFRCRRTLPVGAHIELMIDWPSAADGASIELQITGFVVRTDGGKTGVRVTSHRFRVAQEPAAAIQEPALAFGAIA